jgi:hypothetical protein
VVFYIYIMALIALFCNLKINFAFAELPQNINPYDNMDWKYTWYKVRTVSNPDTLLTTRKPKHILHNLFASFCVCVDDLKFLSSHIPKNCICSS